MIFFPSFSPGDTYDNRTRTCKNISKPPEPFVQNAVSVFYNFSKFPKKLTKLSVPIRVQRETGVGAEEKITIVCIIREHYNILMVFNDHNMSDGHFFRKYLVVYFII